jgi:hypothetical protein
MIVGLVEPGHQGFALQVYDPGSRTCPFSDGNVRAYGHDFIPQGSYGFRLRALIIQSDNGSIDINYIRVKSVTVRHFFILSSLILPIEGMGWRKITHSPRYFSPFDR